MQDASSNTSLFEDMVDVFEFETFRLWEESIYKWDPERVEDREDDEDAPRDVRDCRWSHLNHREHAHPIEKGRDRRSPRPNARCGYLRKKVNTSIVVVGAGTNLRRVQPWLYR